LKVKLLSRWASVQDLDTGGNDLRDPVARSLQWRRFEVSPDR
jgi:hypothetical protein